MFVKTQHHRSGEAEHGVVVKNQLYDDWIKDIPDQDGKVAIVTGANSGTGFWAANALASKGCAVVLACRNKSKATAAKEEILGRFPDAKLDVIVLDNLDLRTVRSFVGSFDKKYNRLDYLLNNAGIMAQPLKKSKDGHDIQFQTNHLAHFLLTQLLWGKMLQTPGQSRIINHSSLAHKLGSTKFEAEKVDNPTYAWGFLGFNVILFRVVMWLVGIPYGNWTRYCCSKLCNILITNELARQIQDKSLEQAIISVGCHPGYANTNIQNVGRDSYPYWEWSNALFAQSAADGSLPLLMATISKDVQNGDFIGPKYLIKGLPAKDSVGSNGGNKEMAKKLWAYSEECTKGSFRI